MEEKLDFNPNTLTTVDEVYQYLDKVQQTANDSLQCAITAQMQMIKYIQSPNLVDSSFDLIIENLRKTLDSNLEPSLKVEARDIAQLMIHNFIFFSYAKLEYASNKNKKEGMNLLQNAADELANSVNKVLTFIYNNDENNKPTNKLEAFARNLGGSMNPSIAVGLIAADLLASVTKKDGIWSRTISFFIGKKNIEKQYNDFYEMIDKIFHKLSKYRTIIGKSNFISDVIERYSPNLIARKVPNYRLIYSIIFAIVAIGFLLLCILNVSAWLFTGFGVFLYNIITKDKQNHHLNFETYWLYFGYFTAILLLIALVVYIIHEIKLIRVKMFYKKMSKWYRIK